MPLSAISVLNSGGVASRAVLAALVIPFKGSWRASRISLLLIVKLLGIPSDKFLPFTSISWSSLPGYAVAIVCLILSAVASPIKIP